MTSSIPDDNSTYMDRSYWDTRYSNEDRSDYDWFIKYSSIRDIFHQTAVKSHMILNLGCGNSSLSENMFADGYTNIVNIDYSDVVIGKMKDKNDVTKQMTWLTMDARSLQFNDNYFDIVIEKGTLDAILTSERDPWNISDDNKKLIAQILSEVSRILKSGGKFISVTFSQPHFRVPLYGLVDYNWSLGHSTIGSNFHYYIYTMEKGSKLDISRYYLPKSIQNDVVASIDDSDSDFLTNIKL